MLLVLSFFLQVIMGIQVLNKKVNSKKINGWLAVAIAGTLPLPFKINIIAFIAFVLFNLLMFRFRKDLPTLGKTFLIIPLCYLGMNFIGLLYSDNLSEALFSIEKRLAFIIFPLIFLALETDFSNFYKKIFLTFAASSIAIALINIFVSVFKYFDTYNETHLGYHQTTSFTGINVIHLSIYLNVSLVILIYYYFCSKNKYLFIPCLLCVGILIYLGSRMAIFILFVIVLLSFIILFKSKFNFIKSGIFTIITLLILTGIVFINPKTSQKFNELQLSSRFEKRQGRYLIWKSSFEILKNDPKLLIYGLGTGDVTDALVQKYEENNYKFLASVRYGPHNEFLQELLKHGIFGLSLLLLMFLLPLKFAIKKRNYLCVAFILIFSFSSLTEPTLGRNKGIFLFTFFYSIFASSLAFSNENFLTNTAKNEFIEL